MTPSPEQSSLVERLRVALSWIEPPFVTAETSADELRSRISFCLADAERALERLSQPSDGVTEAMEALQDARTTLTKTATGSMGSDELTVGRPFFDSAVRNIDKAIAAMRAATSSDRSE